MFAFILIWGSLTASLVLLILMHIYGYFRDAKGLRIFPGMTSLAPFTNIPYMYHSSLGQRYKMVHEAHRKFGPIIRVGPSSLSFNDLQAVRDIYGHGTHALKDHFYSNLAGTHRHLADVSDKADHSRKRRVLSAAFSQAGLERWEHIVAGRAGALLDQYDKLCREPAYHPTPNADPSARCRDYQGFVNHRYWMGLFAQDAIAQIALSADLEMIERGNDLVTIRDFSGAKSTFSYRESLWSTLRVTSYFCWSNTWYSHLRKCTFWHPYWAKNDNFNAMCLHLVQERLKRYEAGEKLDDFFAHLFEDKSGKANLYPMGELVAEANIMLNAGSDTTAIALTNVLYWLLKYRTCFDKLRAELDGVLDSKAKVAPFDRVKYLPYLRACLDESMRLTPPNTMNLPRLTPPGGMSIMGHWIPGDTTVHSPTYSLHRKPAIFEDPEAYRPERWLGDKGKDLQAYFLPFSTGARGCIGRNITYLEQTVMLACIVHRYDMELISDDWVLTQEEALTCSPGDMPIRLTRRRQHVQAV